MLYETIVEEIAKTEVYGRKIYEKALQNRVNKAYVIGAGDSYAAALTVQGVTYGKFKAMDPYEGLFLQAKKDIPYIVVSVSGRTRENIRVARKIKAEGGRIIAVTSNPNSELASIADSVVLIDYEKPKYPIPGTLSFTLSTIALYGLAGIEVDFKEIMKIEQKKLVGLEPIFIGTLGGYGVAYYSALKFYETFGSKARFERTEQFCHATMFSVRENDQIIMYPTTGDVKASEIMEKAGKAFDIIVYDRCEGEIKPLCQIVDFQKSLAEYIRELGLRRPYYIVAKEVLEISSELIY